MAHILIVNGHHPYSFSEGKLTAALVAHAKQFFESHGDEVRITETAKDYDVEKEVEKLTWADTVIYQFPINWMSVPWSFKKYQDEVFTAGIDGRLTTGDGRSEEAPKENYGRGGSLSGSKYMMSVTFNAPSEAFEDEAEFFEGGTVDDLLYWMHLNGSFFAMDALPTFAAYDVMKNPEIEADFARFDAHLKTVFGAKATEAAA